MTRSTDDVFTMTILPKDFLLAAEPRAKTLASGATGRMALHFGSPEGA